ncbi:LPD38 domain-containing protein [Polluticaenibacter yanchengensis]|uniref:Large polyvalent protein associated domain-containing protein n=1 Tax=Polluticaenibacter yanchengensis TaxID=3014562 RepID=A0ABT4UIW5_9BACT|nr:hypothetical protein [Chitinophagaceae bacterium LY-5]
MDEKLFKALQDYVATYRSGKYKDWETMNSKFPELAGYELSVLQDYAVTANSGKYKTWEEVNAKFPEFQTPKPVAAQPKQQPEVQSQTNQPVQATVPTQTQETTKPAIQPLPTENGNTPYSEMVNQFFSTKNPAVSQTPFSKVIDAPVESEANAFLPDVFKVDKKYARDYDAKSQAVKEYEAEKSNFDKSILTRKDETGSDVPVYPVLRDGKYIDYTTGIELNLTSDDLKDKIAVIPDEIKIGNLKGKNYLKITDAGNVAVEPPLRPFATNELQMASVVDYRDNPKAEAAYNQLSPNLKKIVDVSRQEALRDDDYADILGDRSSNAPKERIFEKAPMVTSEDGVSNKPKEVRKDLGTGDFMRYLMVNPDMAEYVDKSLNRLGEEYKSRIDTQEGAFNVIKIALEDKYKVFDKNIPIPKDEVDLQWALETDNPEIIQSNAQGYAFAQSSIQAKLKDKYRYKIIQAGLEKESDRMNEIVKYWSNDQKQKSGVSDEVIEQKISNNEPLSENELKYVTEMTQAASTQGKLNQIISSEQLQNDPLIQQFNKNESKYKEYAAEIERAKAIKNDPQNEKYLKYLNRLSEFEDELNLARREFKGIVNEQTKQDVKDYKMLTAGQEGFDWQDENYYWRFSPIFKTVESLKSVGQGILQGTAEIASGGLKLATKMFNPYSAYTDAQLDKATDWTKTLINRQVSEEAKAWAADNGFNSGFIDVTGVGNTLGTLLPYIAGSQLATARGASALATDFLMGAAMGAANADKMAQQYGLSGMAYQTYKNASTFVMGAANLLQMPFIRSQAVASNIFKGVVEGSFPKQTTKQLIFNGIKGSLKDIPDAIGDLASLALIVKATEFGDAKAGQLANFIQDEDRANEQFDLSEMAGIKELLYATAFYKGAIKAKSITARVKGADKSYNMGRQIQEYYDNIGDGLIDASTDNYKAARSWVDDAINENPNDPYLMEIERRLLKYADGMDHMPQYKEQKIAIENVQNKIARLEKSKENLSPEFHEPVNEHIADLRKQISKFVVEPSAANKYIEDLAAKRTKMLEQTEGTLSHRETTENPAIGEYGNGIGLKILLSDMIPFARNGMPDPISVSKHFNIESRDALRLIEKFNETINIRRTEAEIAALKESGNTIEVGEPVSDAVKTDAEPKTDKAKPAPYMEPKSKPVIVTANDPLAKAKPKETFDSNPNETIQNALGKDAEYNGVRGKLEVAEDGAIVVSDGFREAEVSGAKGNPEMKIGEVEGLNVMFNRRSELNKEARNLLKDEANLGEKPTSKTRRIAKDHGIRVTDNTTNAEIVAELKLLRDGEPALKNEAVPEPEAIEQSVEVPKAEIEQSTPITEAESKRQSNLETLAKARAAKNDPSQKLARAEEKLSSHKEKSEKQIADLTPETFEKQKNKTVRKLEKDIDKATSNVAETRLGLIEKGIDPAEVQKQPEFKKAASELRKLNKQLELENGKTLESEQTRLRTEADAETVRLQEQVDKIKSAPVPKESPSTGLPGDSATVDSSTKATPNADKPEAQKSGGTLSNPDYKRIDGLTGEAIKVAPEPVAAGGEIVIPRKSMKKLIDALGIKTVYQRMKAGVLGFYRAADGAVRMGKLDDMGTMAHEIAHKLDDRLGLTKGRGSAALESELKWFFDRGGSNPPDNRGLTDAEKLQYLRQEGLAEFVRSYVSDPVKTQATASELTSLFKSKMPKEWMDAIETFGREYRNYQHNIDVNPQEHAASRIESSLDKRTRIERMLDWAGLVDTGQGMRWNMKDKLEAALFDRAAAFHKAVEELKFMTGKYDLLESNNPSVLLRALSHIGAKVDDALRLGIRNADMKVITENGEVINLDYLTAKMDKSSKKALLKDFMLTKNVMVAERTLELYDRRVKSLLDEGKTPTRQDEYKISGLGSEQISDVEMAKKVLDSFNNMDAATKDRVNESARRYRVFADHTLQYLRDKGRISDEQYKQYKDANQFYVAFNRLKQESPDVFESDAGHRGSSNLATPDNVIKQAKGSDSIIKDPYESLIDNYDRIIREADRNDVMRSFYDLAYVNRTMHGALENEVGKIVRIETEPVKGSTTVYIDGQKKYMVMDKNVQKALDNMVDTGMNPGIFGWYGKILRGAVTLAPTFFFRNIVRDTQHRMLISDSIRNPLTAPADTIRAFIGEKKHWSDVAAAGGLSGGYYFKDKATYYGMMNEHLQDTVKKGASYINPLNWGKAWEGYKKLLEKGELLNRVAEYRTSYKKAIKEGKSEKDAMLYAAMKSADLIDFARGGNLIVQLNKFVPFTNAAFQGLHSSFISLKRNPALMFSKNLIWYGMARALEMAWNTQDKDNHDLFSSLTAHDRDMFLNFFIDGKRIIIPLAFEQSLMTSGMSRAFDSLFFGKKFDYKGYAKSIGNALLPIDESALFPGMKPIAEVLANYNFYTGNQIVPHYEKDKALELRDGQKYASPIGQLIGSAISVDARVIDHMFKGFGAYFANYSMSASYSMVGDKKKGLNVDNLGFSRSTNAAFSWQAAEFNKLKKELGEGNDREMKIYKKLEKAIYERSSTPEEEKENNIALLDFVKERLPELKQKLKEIRNPRPENVKKTFNRLIDTRNENLNNE